MSADQQAVQQSVLYLVILDCSYQFHIIFGVDVVCLEFHFDFQGAICPADGLFYHFSIGFYDVDLGLIDIVPFFFCIRDF